MSPDESVQPPFCLELGHSSFLSLRLLGCELIHTAVRQHSQVHTAQPIPGLELTNTCNMQDYIHARQNDDTWVSASGACVQQQCYTVFHALIPKYTKISCSCFTATGRDRWPRGGEEEAPCLLWCSGRWHCANACWCDQREEEINTRLKVGIFVVLWAA